MRKFSGLLTLILVLTLPTFSHAQSASNTLKGKVEDNAKQPIQAASVSLLSGKDSSVVKITVSGKEGQFEFVNLPDGRYLVSYSAVGFATTYTPAFDLAGGQSKSLENVSLAVQTKDLKAATVIARKPLVEQKLDRMIVNVEAAVTNAGANALEVLEKSPGISVDKDGNISLKGKQGVAIYIDGRPSYLAGADLVNYLRTLNAGQLDQIEIMTNPPAKYDAAGNSGVINIKTKKTKTVGYSGSLSLGYGQGRYPKLNESFNFNYRKNKVNFFTTFGYNWYKNFNNLDIQRRFIDGTTKEVVSHFDQESKMRNNNQSFNGKVGMDFFATKKTTFGIVLGGFNNPGVFTNYSDVFISDNERNLNSITRANTRTERSWKNFNSNLNFRHVFDTTGKEITADVDYIAYRSQSDLQLFNSYYDAQGTPIMKADSIYGNLPQDINIYVAKADYLHPMKKNAKLEAGIKSSYVTTDNVAAYDSMQNGELVHDFRRSNSFVYKENINAAYINYSRPLTKKLSGQFGLRLENTIAEGRQVINDSSFKRNYTQLFPTAYLQYTVDKNNSFVLNYGRRVQRPSYEDMNPFILFLDKYTFEQGNPDLKPQFSHNIELTHTFKGFLNTTLNYTKTNDIITEVLNQRVTATDTVTFVVPRNIASQRQYGIAVSAGVPIAKWWTANIWANVYNNLYTGVVNGDAIELGATTGQFNITNLIKINKTLSAELSGYYRTPSVDGVFRIENFGMVNLGISQQIMKGKGTVRLNVRDLFWTQKIDGSSRFSNIDAAFQQERESRVFNVNFTYRFSKGKTATTKRRTAGSSDEQNRVKVEN